MDQKYLKERRNIKFCAATITCLVMGVMLRYGCMTIISSQITQIVSIVFIYASYFMLLCIGRHIKKQGVHGIQNIAWSALIFYSLSLSSSAENVLWISIIHAITVTLCMFFLVDGIIRFGFSLVTRLKEMDKNGVESVDSIETVVAILTSLSAIVFSIIEISS